MSGSPFEEFADAMASSPRAAPGTARRFERIAVLGGGKDARLIAALCLAAGAGVILFSAYGAELDALRRNGGVTLRGEGPIGTFQVDREGIPSIRTTAELDTAISQADLIFLTGPVHKQRTYAMVLADHLRDGQVLVLAPGRSLGAAETAWLLRVGGCRADYTIIEAQGLPYWTTETGGTLTLARTGHVAAATLPAGRRDALDGLAAFFPNLDPVASTIHAGFHDASALVELPALLMGGPALPDSRPAVPAEAKPLAENATFRSLIGEKHLKIIERMAEERRLVASRFGVRDLPDTGSWISTYAGAPRGDGARRIPGQAEALGIVRCGTIGSLAPLQSAAQIAGIATPATSAMITLASTVLDADIESAGRSLASIGINASTIDDARRILDTIAGGSR
ncbi:MAG: hypothetical protein Q8S27_12070 [Hoeflea sp.]|nr:hypothetical protein [Hoeflea sp.]